MPTARNVAGAFASDLSHLTNNRKIEKEHKTMPDITHLRIDNIREVATPPAGFQRLTTDMATRFNTTTDALLRRVPTEALCRSGDTIYINPQLAARHQQRVI